MFIFHWLIQSSHPITNCTPFLRIFCKILALPIESEMMDGFWHSRCLKQYSTTVDKIITGGQIFMFEASEHLSWHQYSHETKLSRLGLAGLTMVVNLDFQMTISQLFQDLHGSNLKFKLINPQPITRTYMDTNLRRFGLAGLPMAAILNFIIFMSQ